MIQLLHKTLSNTILLPTTIVALTVLGIYSSEAVVYTLSHIFNCNLGPTPHDSRSCMILSEYACLSLNPLTTSAKKLTESIKFICDDFKLFMKMILILHFLIQILKALRTVRTTRTLKSLIEDLNRKVHVEDRTSSASKCLPSLQILARCILLFCIYTAHWTTSHFIFEYIFQGDPNVTHADIEILLGQSGQQNISTTIALQTTPGALNVRRLYNNFLIYQDEQIFDVLNPMNILSLDSSSLYGKNGIKIVNDIQVLLYGQDEAIRIDVVDDSSMKVVETTPFMALLRNISVSNTVNDFQTSPNGETIGWTDGHTSNFYITNISSPQDTIIIESLHSVQHYMFCPDSKSGYILQNVDSHTLQFYRFEVNLNIITTKGQQISGNLSTFVFSENCETVFMSFGGFGSPPNATWLTIMNLTDSDDSSNKLSTLYLPPAVDSQTFTMAMVLSNDHKTLFQLGRNFNLIIIDVSNVQEPTALSSLITNRNLDDYGVMTLSSDNGVLVIGNSLKPISVIDVTDPKNPIHIDSNIEIIIYGVAFLPDSRYLFASTLQGFTVISLVVDTWVNVVCTSTNILFQEPIDNESVKIIATSPDLQTIVTVSHYDKFQRIAPETQGLIPLDSFVMNLSNITDLIITPHQDVAIAMTNDSIVILNISSTVQSVISSIRDNYMISSRGLARCVLLDDETTLICSYIQLNITGLVAYNTSNIRSLSQPKVLLEMNSDPETIAQFIISSDMIAITNGSNLCVYQILKELELINTFCENAQLGQKYYSIDIAPTSQVLVAGIDDTVNMIKAIFIWNVQNYIFPGVIRFLQVGKYDVLWPSDNKLFFFNEYTLIVPYHKGALLIDMADKLSPFICGSIPYNAVISSVTRSTRKGHPIMIVDDISPTLQVVTVKDEYVMSLPEVVVGRGEVHYGQISVLKKNIRGNYTLQDRGYSFTSTSLYNSFFDRGTLFQKRPLLPSWISFDALSATLRVAPTSDTVIGTYYFYVTLSSQVQATDFDLIEGINSQQLMKDLLIFGYINNNYYVTNNFDVNNELILPFSYSQNKVHIQKVLAKHVFTSIKRLNIKSSLSLRTDSSVLKVDSASLLPLTVTISLEKLPNQTVPQCQFASKFDSAITLAFGDNFTVLTFQNLLFQANDAFAKIVINLQNDVAACDGIITMQDGLNPTFSESVTNISEYFKKNYAPALNLNASLQIDVNKVRLRTSTYFTIDLREDYFNETGLTLTLLSDDYRSWLRITGYTLTGTMPPGRLYQVWPNRYSVWIRASNQYKSVDVLIKLEVMISLADWLKLMATIISAIGFYVYFTSVRNVLCKRLYKDPKPWVLGVDEEVTPHTILPFAFIGEEVEKSRVLLRYLCKAVARRRDVRSISKAELVTYLKDPVNGEVDEKKLQRLIKDVSRNLKALKQPKFKFSYDKDLVYQLIVNELALSQISSKEEWLTDRVFRKVRNRWRGLVRQEGSHLWRLKVDESELMFELEVNGVYAACIIEAERSRGVIAGIKALFSSVFTEMESKAIDPKLQSTIPNAVTKTESAAINHVTDDDNTTDQPQQERFLRINVDLLKRVLIAYAFRKHHLSTSSLVVNVQSYLQSERISTLPRSISRFLMLDLSPLPINLGNSINSGIKYRIEHDVLEFFGTASEDVEERTIIVHVVNQSGSILKEITICGSKAGIVNKDLHAFLLKQ